jgi:hypothetical protein
MAGYQIPSGGWKNSIINEIIKPKAIPENKGDYSDISSLLLDISFRLR